MTPTGVADIQTGDDQHEGESLSPEEQAARAASEGEQLSEEQVQSATSWFLAEEDEAPATLTFDVNVAPHNQHPKWVRWTVRTLSRQTIKQIREDATKDGVEDDLEVNLRTVIAGSVQPNFADEAIRHGYADPADVLNKKLKHKPGLIERIAFQVNNISGYGAAGATAIRPVDAAGN